MTITNSQTGTSIEEIAAGIYRVSTPIPPSPEMPPGFSFNQILIAAEEPLLFHTGPRAIFPLVREAVRAVIPPETLRYIGFSHTEGDECDLRARERARSTSRARQHDGRRQDGVRRARRRPCPGRFHVAALQGARRCAALRDRVSVRVGGNAG